jgi:hypothetical protein
MSALLTQNAGITTQAVYEINERFFNDVLFRYLERGSTHLTSTELQRLQIIAAQCPLSGGKAVFDARALLSIARDSLVWYDHTCTGGQQFRAIDNTDAVASAVSVELFPNPANGEATVQWGVPLEAEGRLDIYDTLGRLHRSEVLAPGSSQHKLMLEGLDQGLYYVDVQIGVKRSTLKLVVNP